ncbi:10740_t:CDS:2 [Funneliformis geosporum]|uniref:2550_t:CDS:1 n=1 Tax=Funneliformis geosporum TaxID=1117311 RepID=A0A9W4SJZ9_9GLOM|nr:2550_t:CDS:2 [Funneliformis geosporum]CAI2172009.1 10740_t:CDS:2 [Funneliformis geosporum]
MSQGVGNIKLQKTCESGPPILPIVNIEESMQNRSIVSLPNVEGSNSKTLITSLDPNDPNSDNMFSDSKEVIIPLSPLKKVITTNSDNGYLPVQDSDSNRISQASSGSGSLPSWAYAYYTLPSDSNRDTLLQDRTDESDIIILDPSTSAAAGVGTPDYSNKKSNSQKSPSSRSKPSRFSFKIPSTTSFYTLSQRAYHYSREPFIICPFGSVLFTMGFLFPPLWWFGSFYPRHSKSTTDFRWKKYNRLMSIFSFFLIAGILVITIWYLRYYEEPDEFRLV